MITKPFLKWAGGKTKLLPEIHRRLPESWNRYYEPFLGGGAVFFGLPEARVAILGDANEDLIATYRAVAGDVESVIDLLEGYATAHSKDHYYQIRDRWNARHGWSNQHTAAVMIYLNKTCFNGLWRVNKLGEFNVPMGDYEDPAICDELVLRGASMSLSRVRFGDFHGEGYEATTETATAGDFVYVDPPYAPASDTANFTAYTAGGFRPDAQEALALHVRALVSRGCKVMVSNSDVPLVRELYRGDRFRIDQVRCPRAINSEGSKRGTVGEVLIMGGY